MLSYIYLSYITRRLQLRISYDLDRNVLNFAKWYKVNDKVNKSLLL